MLSKFSRRKRRGHENREGGLEKSWKSVYFAGVECA